MTLALPPTTDCSAHQLVRGRMLAWDDDDLPEVWETLRCAVCTRAVAERRPATSEEVAALRRAAYRWALGAI